MAHYQFETIHPFEDGNGRTGRLLIIIQLCLKKLIDKPSFYLSGTLLNHRHEYFSRLQEVRTEGRLETWLIFFCKVITEQA